MPLRLAWLALLLVGGVARAQPRSEPITLRLASVAPEGTAWARELRAFARDVETESEGGVRIKLYLGGIAGDELQMLERMKRAQLDSAASGGPICERLAPSMRVMRVFGLIRDHVESRAVATRLQPQFEQEAAPQGFAFIGSAAIGPQILFSRRPIRSMEELKKVRLWVWEHDDLVWREMPMLGADIVTASLTQAGALYDTAKVDGFVAPASVALAFQWSARTKYVTQLPMALLSACLVVRRATFDLLPIAGQRAVRAAGAKLAARFTDLSRRQDAELLGGLFQKQGLIRIDIDDRFRADFYEAARRAREKLAPSVVDPTMLSRVQSILADFRAENRQR